MQDPSCPWRRAHCRGAIFLRLKNESDSRSRGGKRRATAVARLRKKLPGKTDLAGELLDERKKDAKREVRSTGYEKSRAEDVWGESAAQEMIDAEPW